jgi:hypothetical protein
MDLHNVFLHAHRGFAYLILLIVALFIVSLLAVMFGYSGKINKLLRKSTLFTMIFFHTQFLIGLAMLLFASSFMSIVKANGMGFIMKNADLRFTYIEHPFSMLVAAVLLTIANKNQTKRNHEFCYCYSFGNCFSIILLCISFC